MMKKTLLYTSVLIVSLLFQDNFPYVTEFTPEVIKYITNYNMDYLLKVNPTLVFFGTLLIFPIFFDFIKNLIIKRFDMFSNEIKTFLEYLVILFYGCLTLPLFQPIYILYKNLVPINIFDSKLQQFNNIVFNNQYILIKKTLTEGEIVDSINSCLFHFNHLPDFNLKMFYDKLFMLLKNNKIEEANIFLMQMKENALTLSKKEPLTFFESCTTTMVNGLSCVYDTTLYLCSLTGSGVQRISTSMYNTIENDPQTIVIGLIVFIGLFYFFGGPSGGNTNTVNEGIVNNLTQVSTTVTAATQNLEIVNTSLNVLKEQVSTQGESLTGLSTYLTRQMIEISRETFAKSLEANQVITETALDLIIKAALQTAKATAKEDSEEGLKVFYQSLIALWGLARQNCEMINKHSTKLNIIIDLLKRNSDK